MVGVQRRDGGASPRGREPECPEADRQPHQGEPQEQDGRSATEKGWPTSQTRRRSGLEIRPFSRGLAVTKHVPHACKNIRGMDACHPSMGALKLCWYLLEIVC